MVEYLGQDDNPLHFRVDSLKDKNAGDFFLKDVNIPDPRSMDNAEFKIFQTITEVPTIGWRDG